MKKGIKILFFLSAWIIMNSLLIPVGGTASAETSDAQNLKDFLASSLKKNEVAFMCLDYSGVIMRVSDQTILIDPSNQLSKKDLETLKSEGVDLVLYTHEHLDHFNRSTALKLFQGSQASIATDPGLNRLLKNKIPPEKLISATAGKSFTIGKITLDAIKGKHGVPITLYRMTIGDITIFHGGDSSYVPLVDYPSHLAFLPTGSPPPTCSPEDAFRMASDLKPRIAVTIHGDNNKYTEFKEMVSEKLPNTKVIIPEYREAKKVTFK